jgi:hypothetical protein
MADPLIVDISTEWEWQKVATSVTTGMIHRLTTVVEYYQTYRLTGEAAPAAPVLGTLPQEAVRLFDQLNSEEISSSTAIDVYIMVKYDNTLAGRDGKIRVDV